MAVPQLPQPLLPPPKTTIQYANVFVTVAVWPTLYLQEDNFPDNMHAHASLTLQYRTFRHQEHCAVPFHHHNHRLTHQVAISLNLWESQSDSQRVYTVSYKNNTQFNSWHFEVFQLTSLVFCFMWSWFRTYLHVWRAQCFCIFYTCYFHCFLKQWFNKQFQCSGFRQLRITLTIYTKT